MEALQNPGKYERHAPKLVLDKGKLSVTSQIGLRSGLAAGAYDPGARIKALDQMQIDMQAISPSPILLFYWEEPAVAAHFSRKQNAAIQAVVQKHPDRFVGFGSVPLQSVVDSIAIAEEAKSMGATERQILMKITLPAIVPWITTGLKISLPYAIVAAVVGEFIAAGKGLGYLINYNTSLFSTTGALGGILVLAMVVVICNEVINRAESYLLRWRPREERKSEGELY